MHLQKAALHKCADRVVTEGLKSHRITEQSVLERSQEDHGVQLLDGPHRDRTTASALSAARSDRLGRPPHPGRPKRGQGAVTRFSLAGKGGGSTGRCSALLHTCRKENSKSVPVDTKKTHTGGSPHDTRSALRGFAAPGQP